MIFHATVAGAPDRHKDIFINAVFWRRNVREAEPILLALDLVPVADGIDDYQKGRNVVGRDIIFFQHAVLVFLPPADFFCLGLGEFIDNDLCGAAVIMGVDN